MGGGGAKGVQRGRKSVCVEIDLCVEIERERERERESTCPGRIF